MASFARVFDKYDDSGNQERWHVDASRIVNRLQPTRRTKYFDPPPTISQDDLRRFRCWTTLVEKGLCTVPEVARDYRVHRSTVYRGMGTVRRILQEAAKFGADEL